MRNVSRGIRPGPSLVVALPLALLSMLAMAGSSSTTLPNGAALTVSIDDPVTSTEFEVPPGQPGINVPVQGTASVGLGEPDASFIYVMDLSGSTDNGSGTGCAPVLDCEKKFVKALNQAVIDGGSADEVGKARGIVCCRSTQTSRYGREDGRSTTCHDSRCRGLGER